MAYSDLYAPKQVKIPSWLGILTVFLATFVLGRFLLTGTSAPSSRASQNAAKGVQVTNTSPTQATVFWQTDSAVTGWVLYGERANSLSRIALDERDLEGVKQSFRNHHATLKNLKEDTPYFYKLVVGNEVTQGANGEPFTFRTLPNAVPAATLRPAYGRVVSSSGEPLEDAVVILSADGAYPLSTVSKTSGEWLIPLNYIVSNTTNEVKALSQGDVVHLEIIADDGVKSSISATLSNTSPLPQTVVIGRNYDFTQGQEVLSAAAAAPAAKVQTIDIVYPRRNAVIASPRPLIKGTAVPGKTVKVTIVGAGRSQSSNVTTDAKGGWQLPLGNRLNPAEYSLTISTTDTAGRPVQKTQFFSIGKSGEQVLAEATGSATITPTSTPSATVTVTPTAIPTVTSTVFATPTPEPPVTGGNVIPFFVSSASLILLGIGLMLAF